MKAFASAIIRGYIQNRAQIDAKIQNASRNWTLDRMFSIDRNILRLAAYELLYERDIPYKVSINEAVELAKKFSSGNSGKFVNGVLDTVRRENPGEKAA